MKRALLTLLLLLAGAPHFAEDLVVFVNGDRLSGAIVATGTKRVRLRTPFGRLEIPNTEIERLVWEDGREEVLTPPAAPPPPKTTADLVLLVNGNTFWQAWDPQLPPADPSLRLVVRLDGGEVVAWSDVNLDPEDLPGAVVNSFVFDPERLFVRPADGVKAVPPETGTGGIRLALELPLDLVGDRWLSAAYQVNDASSSYPQWRDLVDGGTRVQLAAESPVHVRLEQDRGLMEYNDRSMQAVETFRVVAREISPSP